jgi:hypothetical protein
MKDPIQIPYYEVISFFPDAHLTSCICISFVFCKDFEKLQKIILILYLRHVMQSRCRDYKNDNAFKNTHQSRVHLSYHTTAYDQVETNIKELNHKRNVNKDAKLHVTLA